jgi:ssDNA-binding Zn-finger/Zn-ribbon topoisomerase 1
MPAVRTELESLNAALGRGPASLLLWLAEHGGKFGPAGASHIHNDENAVREWRRSLEAAGKLRTELDKGKGYSYELLVDLTDPTICVALEQWQQECKEEAAAEAARREAQAKRDAEYQAAWEAKRQKKRDYRDRYLRKKFGTCPECGAALIQRTRHSDGHAFVGCTSWPECTFAAPTPEQITEAHEARIRAIEEAKRECTEQAEALREKYGSCERCGSPMRFIQGKRGPFLGCTGYPQCRFTVTVRPQAQPEGSPVQPVQNGNGGALELLRATLGGVAADMLVGIASIGGHVRWTPETAESLEETKPALIKLQEAGLIRMNRLEPGCAVDIVGQEDLSMLTAAIEELQRERAEAAQS